MNPPITMYPNHAAILSIALQERENWNWFFNTYLSITMRKNGSCRIDFSAGIQLDDSLRNCPVINVLDIPREYIACRFPSCTDFFIDCLNNDSYLLLLVDGFYISAYTGAYQKFHFTHDLLIHGYDTDAQQFEISDFFGTKYSHKTASFEEIRDSFQIPDELDWYNGIRVITPHWCRDNRRNNYCNYRILTPEGILTRLNCHLASQSDIYLWPTSESRDYVYGIEVFDQLINLIQKDNSYALDKRNFYLFYDHFTYLELLCKELYSSNMVNDIQKEIYLLSDMKEQMNKLIMLSIKNHLKCKTNQMEQKETEKIINGLKWAKNKDKLVCQQLVQKLKFSRKVSVQNTAQTFFIHDQANKDFETLGSWQGKYGKLGLIIPNVAWNLPDKIKININYTILDFFKPTQYTLENLVWPEGQERQRIVARFSSDHDIMLFVSMEDEITHNIALYFTNPFDPYLAMESPNNSTIYICIYEGDTKEILIEDRLESAYKGVYCSYALQGKCTIEIKHNPTTRVDLSGVFID